MSIGLGFSITSILRSEFNRVHPDFLYSDGNTYTVNVEGSDFGLGKAFLGIVGSQSHNTYVPKTDPDAIDDIDVMGVVPLPASHLFGLKSFEHWSYKEGELDVIVYSLPKFVNLLLKGNPNVMGLLWLREEEQLQVPEWWNRLVINRWMFASKKNVYDSFVGYAKGQMERMTSYTPEIDEELKFLEEKLELYGIAHEDVMNNRVGAVKESPLGGYIQRYRILNKKYHFAYMGDKRKQLVKKYGFDLKNAAHMIRLLGMAIEYLETGEMFVYRTDNSTFAPASMIQSIKRGEWALEDVKLHADMLFRSCEQAYANSTLPELPDVENANDLLGEIAQENC
jgi:predicted nucleotidyltransferase